MDKQLKTGRSDRILRFLKVWNRIPFVTRITDMFYGVKPSEQKVSCAGMTFDHPLGIAGGIDTTGEFCNIAASYGAGFVEIGPLDDIMAAINNLRSNPSPVPVLAVIPDSDAEKTFALLYDFVDAVVADINESEFDSDSMEMILQLRLYNDEYKPVFFRIPPGMTEEKLDEVMDYALSRGVDGIMAPGEKLEKVAEMALEHMDIICYGHFEDASAVAAALKGGAKAVAITDKPGEMKPSFIKKVIKNIYTK